MLPERRRLAGMVTLDPEALLPLTRTLSLKLFGAVVVILAIIAAADYLFQYRQWFERQKMSLREIKEEFKQSDGDPKIKQRIKQLRASRAKKRMMTAVPKATVVITNPTHYAVALQYEPGMAAPICLAKGVDSLALKIREVAARHNVAIVENPPLARTLHAAVDIDQEIPTEHYKAVAEVIGYVMRLNGARRTSDGR
jgi:flagellar biosynthesis protein FlhB